MPVSNKPIRPAERRIEDKDILASAYHLSFSDSPKKKEGGRGEPPKKDRNILKKSMHQIKEGWVYVIRSNGLSKIGRTKNLTQRLKDYQTQNPFTTTVFKAFFEDCVTLEKELHELFKSKRKVGEWFELTDTDIQNMNECLAEITTSRLPQR